MNEIEAFDDVKKSIYNAMEEIKSHSPALYEDLKKYIVMDEETKTVIYIGFWDLPT